MTSSITVVPSAARWLGFNGLVPFLGAALAGLAPVPPFPAISALIAYGAVILSFLGGIRGVLAMGAANAAWRLGIGILPSLLADLRLPEAPDWYPRLRLPLSCGAIACLLLGLLG